VSFKTHHRSVSTAPIGVAIVDKSPLILRALKSMLLADERFELAVSATDGERFLEALNRVRFDVAVIGWTMPYCDGRTVLKRLAARENAPRIIVYTGDLSPTVPREVIKLGGAGFCSKTDSPEYLLDVIENVARGQMIFPFMGQLHNTITGSPEMESLTPRESELLSQLSNGSTNNEIARNMGVSLNTVKFHLRNLYSKLGVRNRAEAIARHLAPGGNG
jgi:two-component system nitrate/nitrite response regulator NarP